MSNFFFLLYANEQDKLSASHLKLYKMVQIVLQLDARVSRSLVEFKSLGKTELQKF